jgi:hypothetical protein
MYGATREWPEGSGLGYHERFSAQRAEGPPSGRFRSLADTLANGEVAPKPVIPVSAIKRRLTPSGARRFPGGLRRRTMI